MFRREGEFWTLRFEGRICRLRDSRGLRHLAELLRRPGQAIAASRLSRAAEHGEAIEDSHVVDESLTPTSCAGENARVRVTRAIAAALARIAEHHPAFGAHLRATVRTGQRCSYTPDPRLPVEWET